VRDDDNDYDGDGGAVAIAIAIAIDVAVASADYTAFSMRLAPLNSGSQGFKGFARDTRGGERRYSRVIKDSPGRTDAKINKPAVMNEAGSLESSRVYPVLIVTEIRASPSGQIC
jgi:hypothetical protein